jgi:NitT/TauT family transport system substrate-binding protein
MATNPPMVVTRAAMLRRGAAAVAAIPTAMPAMQTASRSDDLPSIRVASPPIDDYKTVYYGVQSGIFRKYGVVVETTLTTSGAAALAALAGGSVQVAGSSLPSLLQAHQRGVPFKIVAPAQWYLSERPSVGLLVNAKSPIRTGKDLNGKTIATSSLKDLYATATLAWIDDNGGDSHSVRIIELPASSIVVGIEDGRIDAASIAEPFLSAALASGKVRNIGKSFDTIGKRFETSVWIAMREEITANRAALSAFGRGMHDAAAYTNAHPAETIDLVASYSGIDRAVIATTVRSTDPEFVDPRIIQPMIEFAAKYGLIERRFDAEDIIGDTALRPPR